MTVELTKQNLERIDQCGAVLAALLPTLRAARGNLPAGVPPEAEASISRQIECMETAAWLCRTVRTALAPVDDAATETRALRLVFLEFARLLGGGRAMADMLIASSRDNVVPSGAARASAESFISELQAVFAKLGVAPQVPVAADPAEHVELAKPQHATQAKAGVDEGKPSGACTCVVCGVRRQAGMIGGLVKQVIAGARAVGFEADWMTDKGVGRFYVAVMNEAVWNERIAPLVVEVKPSGATG